VLPAASRMRHRTEFAAAIRSGAKSGRRLLAGHLLARPGLPGPPRIGFVVGRTVGGAVVRNRVRRQLRHLARGYLQVLPGGSLLVLRAHPAAATARQAEIAAELDLVINALLRRQGGAV
jgi:ribonuclease P protein component